MSVVTAPPASRAGNVVGVVLDVVSRVGAGAVLAARYAGVFLRGRRRLTLPGLASAGCFAGAGFTVSMTVGLIVSGVTLLAIDWKLTGGAGGTDG